VVEPSWSDAGHNTAAGAFEEMMLIVSTASDEQLLVATPNDPESFGVFYDRHHLAVLGALRQRAGGIEIALDVAAEVFAAALQRRSSFVDRGPGSAKAWLYAIARNKLIDLYRSGGAEDRARQQLGMRPLVVSDTELDLLERRLDAQSSGVLEALAELPEHERDAVRARVLGDCSYPVIAQSLRVSESVVRQRVSRGLRKLRTTMEAPS
jgi:RNA polymerase sigma-70 factor (ECF subfamily)